ncbi:hypothetical protein [Moorena sp. SIO3B2]|uniref:hypothetical protein n=1 Tax=Moorena sp. SIO3B2 TaxID=2607827 RepID=UPI0013CAE932|nr:hypothetical protein [Moorena sp. SIO3B2]NEP36821.1 hypothetical protein [Moorena sp. SIO3B2]
MVSINRRNYRIDFTISPVVDWVLGSRESGAVRPVANLIRLRKAHRGSRESGE